MKDANAQITHWYLALQSFMFKVVYRLGAQMLVADFLSCLGEGEVSVAGRLKGDHNCGNQPPPPPLVHISEVLWCSSFQV
ncbi:hypothetical protein MHYP_G00351290 [Metynnis hypsauchen]